MRLELTRFEDLFKGEQDYQQKSSHKYFYVYRELVVMAEMIDGIVLNACFNCDIVD